MEGAELQTAGGEAAPTSLAANGTMELKCVLDWSNGTKTDATDAVWASSAPTVAAVDGGTVTWKSAGKTDISATSNGKTAKVTVTCAAASA